MTFDQLLRMATHAERERAYYARPRCVSLWLEKARALRDMGEHIGAGDVERDAAQCIRMAQRHETVRLVAERLGLRNDPERGWVRS